jgi:hypothetical protein
MTPEKGTRSDDDASRVSVEGPAMQDARESRFR